MDARELTKKLYEQENKLTDYEKRIEYLEQELSKLRLIVGDIKIDMQMMQDRRG